jgi:hypothetical protein
VLWILIRIDLDPLDPDMGPFLDCRCGPGSRSKKIDQN